MHLMPPPKRTAQPRAQATVFGLDQWFSNLSGCQNHLEGCGNRLLVSFPRISDSVSLEWALRACVSTKFSGCCLCCGSTRAGRGLDKSRFTLKWREEAEPPLKHTVAWRKRNRIRASLTRKRVGVRLLNGNHLSLLGWKPLKPKLFHKEPIFCGLDWARLLALLINNTQLCCSQQAQG